MDNLSTHSAGALYDAFPAQEARRVLKRLQFHHTPKHASWLDMVEIEIGVLRCQCLDRRIDDKPTILAEVAAWQQRRNAEGALRSSGCSPPRRLAKNSAKPISSRSHNLCGTVLEAGTLECGSDGSSMLGQQQIDVVLD